MNTHITKQGQCTLPTEWGTFIMTGYVEASGQEHIALSCGTIDSDKAILIRIHSECLTGDALFSQRCDCGPQLQAAMQAIQQEGCGVIVYLRQEGRGIGLINKIKAYRLQEEGLDTVDANLALGLPVDARNYSIAYDILTDLGVNNVRLMTNNPIKIKKLQEAGINVVERVEHVVGVQHNNQQYLQTKAEKMGHLLNIEKISLNGTQKEQDIETS